MATLRPETNRQTAQRKLKRKQVNVRTKTALAFDRGHLKKCVKFYARYYR